MKAFLGDSFLLNSQAAERLYFDHAEQLPIYDYHCHLSPKLIADDHQFKNLAEIWLTDDHYKWRVLRTAGVDERLITGNASDEEKYWAWAEALPKALANPVYHWTHLELKRPFGITGVVFGPDSAAEIWQKANALLAKPAFSARGIMRQMNVKMVGTTDDPIDSLEYHRALAEDDPLDIQVRPSWRPDRAFKIELSGFIDYIGRLSAVSGVQITRFAELCQALSNRLDHFSSHGCVAADHGIEVLRFADVPSEGDLDRILARRLFGSTLSEKEIAQYASAVQVWLAKQYCQRRWVMQLHIGALRNNNQRMFALLGGDAGFDSIADRPIAEALSGLLNAMDINDQLPKTILYCLNPTHNEVIATMCGNFQGGGVAGKIQFGSGWWFNDQKEGMERQIMQLSQLGLLSQFVGMLTDSRSFLSYTRHEYFRRILCNRVGSWMERGEIPPDYSVVGTMIENICCYNAKGYFGLK